MSRIPNVQVARIASASMSAVLAILEQMVARNLLPVSAAIEVLQRASIDAGAPNTANLEEMRAFLDQEIRGLRERYPEAP